MAIDSGYLPIENGGSSHSYVNVHQRVCRLMAATCHLSQVGEVRVMEGKKACGCPAGRGSKT